MNTKSALPLDLPASALPVVRSGTQILHVMSTIKGERSRTQRLARVFFKELAARAPGAEVTTIDLFATPPPLDTPTFVALTTSIDRQPLSAEQTLLLSRCDPWIEMLSSAGLLVFTSPLWNYHAPIQLKAFIDMVTRPGRTFQYTAQGPTGVLSGKRAVLLQTRGAWGPDHLGDWLRDCLWLLGGAGLDVIRAAKQDLGSPEEQESEMTRAAEEARTLARKLTSPPEEKP